MGLVRKYYEAEATLREKRQDQLAALRRFHYSVHEEERREAIEVLGTVGDADAARELVQLYRDCEWRATRFACLRALGRNTSQRGLEFLFRVARGNDMPLAETAIWALGQTHSPLAARFLTSFYQCASETLKPAVAGAIGQIPDPNLAGLFLKDLAIARASKNISLMKNLVLTLGELRMGEAVPLLIELAKDRTHQPVSLSALVSLGKISRDPSVMKSLEPLFSRDPLEYQIYLGALGHIRFRSQWTLEDYLQKLFDCPELEPHLPLELNAFRGEDVREGLGLFGEPRHQKRLHAVMSHLDFPQVTEWYQDLLKPETLSEAHLVDWLRSLSSHYSPKVAELLERVRSRLFQPDGSLHEVTLFESWLDTLSLSVPSAAEPIEKIIDAPTFKKLEASQRISTINSLVNFGLTTQAEKTPLEKVGKILVKMLRTESNAAVQGRLIRAFAQLQIREEKASMYVKDSIAKSTLSSSCLLFLESFPHRKSIAVLGDVLTSGPDSVNPVGLMRALAAQEALPEAALPLDRFLKSALASGADVELRSEGLRLLSRHPRPSLYEDVIHCLKGEERLQLGAIIALKAYGKETSASTLAPYLASQNPSIAGRALDGLTSLPGLSPKVLAIDWLRDHPEDTEICDKIIRCLKAPSDEGRYFTAIIDAILKRFPHHPQLDGLVELRERMGTSPTTRASLGILAVEDQAALDAGLTAHIPSYPRLEESVKSVLRSAELPFVHKELFEGSVDKAFSILEFCKSLDLFLERHLGRKLLFPQLDQSLHEFQNVLHAAGLNEDQPSAERVLKQLGLEKHFSGQSLPLHKMIVIARGILSGRILDERFKVLDGLRAWGVMLLLFCRSTTEGGRAVTPLRALSNAQVISIAKRLMVLQDIRNPAAHRQTYLEMVDVNEVRKEVLALLHELESAA